MLRLRLSRLRRAGVLGTTCVAFVAIGISDGAARADAIAEQATRESWSLTLRVSGGFAGLNRELDLDSSGSATATDLRRKRHVRQQISKEELQEIARLVASASSLDVADRTSCRDCLSYSIDLKRREQQLTIRANDVSLSDSNSTSAPLVHALSRLQNRLLSEP